MTGSNGLGAVPRWELYRLLADPVRVRLLALTSAEELSVGELAELLRESQPKVSRHATALREMGLVAARKQGTWVLLRLAPGADSDAVVQDALRAGRTSLQHDRTWDAIEKVIAERDTKAREFFARGGKPVPAGPPSELAAYVVALRALIPERGLAVDIGTGDGALLEVLCPLFERVVAVDRSLAQIDLARERAIKRGFGNVEFVAGEIDLEATRTEILAAGASADRSRSGADVVFASRVLHHATKPERALRSLVELARRPTEHAVGGTVIVIDYAPHDDVELRDAQADVWLGFDDTELREMARKAGLSGISTAMIPPTFRGDGPDRHLDWMIVSGHRDRLRT